MTFKQFEFVNILQQYILSQVYHICDHSMKSNHKSLILNSQTSMQYCAMCHYLMHSMVMFNAIKTYIVQPYNALRLWVHHLMIRSIWASVSIILMPGLNLHYYVTCHFLMIAIHWSKNIVNYMQVQYSIIILFPSKHREELKHQACAHQHFSPTAQQTHHKGDACYWQRKNYIKLIVHFTLLGGT